MGVRAERLSRRRWWEACWGQRRGRARGAGRARAGRNGRCKHSEKRSPPHACGAGRGHKSLSPRSAAVCSGLSNSVARELVRLRSPAGRPNATRRAGLRVVCRQREMRALAKRRHGSPRTTRVARIRAGGRTRVAGRIAPQKMAVAVRGCGSPIWTRVRYLLTTLRATERPRRPEHP